MPFEHGTFTVSFFELPCDLDDNFIEEFQNNRAGLLDSVQDEPQVGWVSGRHLLENNIDEKTAMKGGAIYLNLRKAERKMPGTLLNAICKREELIWLQANPNAQFVPSKVKKQIKEEAREKHIMKMPPAISGIPMVIDPASRMMYLGSSSATQIDDFIGFFYKTTSVEPIQLTPGRMLETMFQVTQSSFPMLSFCDKVDREPSPGRDFLTWLWYYSEDHGKVTHEQFGEFELMLEGPLTFSFLSETSGSAETTVKKGDSPLQSAEAKAALSVGKKLKKAKLTITRGEEIWSGMFDADRFAFGSFSLPEGEEMDQESRFAERMTNLFIFTEGFKLFFKKYAETVLSIHWPEEERRIREWAKNRESF